jgi:hypothetical protein
VTAVRDVLRGALTLRALAWTVAVVLLTATVYRVHGLIARADRILATVETSTLPAADAYLKESTHALQTEQPEILAKVQSAAGEIEGTARAVRAGAEDVRSRLVPEVIEGAVALRRAAGHLEATADEARSLPVALRDQLTLRGEEAGVILRDVDGVVQVAGTQIVETGTRLAESEAALLDILSDVRATTHNVRLVVDESLDPALARKLALHLSATGANVELTTANVAKITSRLTPRERAYAKNPVGRAFQKVGYFLLDVVRASPDATLLVLRAFGR